LLEAAHAFSIALMHVGGREDDEEDDAGKASAGDRAAERELVAANDFIRDVAGRVAFELATTPEGRAAGLSVEVWPAQGVWLRVRSGHELRVLVERRDEVVHVLWERIDPGPRGKPHASQGSLGKARMMGAEDLRVFMARWLALRVRG
jgi:hypothetical protein